MKIIKTKNFPPGTYKCINLFGVLFTKSDRLTERDINHERIHTDQMEEMLYIGFYLWYSIEFLIKLLITFNWKRACYSISFEQEAYENERNLEYLNQRKHGAWLKKVFKLVPKKK